jgi:hypothetical protein
MLADGSVRAGGDPRLLGQIDTWFQPVTQPRH